MNISPHQVVVYVHDCEVQEGGETVQPRVLKGEQIILQFCAVVPGLPIWTEDSDVALIFRFHPAPQILQQLSVGSAKGKGLFLQVQCGVYCLGISVVSDIFGRET